MNKHRAQLTVLLVFVVVALASCPTPFKQSFLDIGFDTTPPTVTISYPADGDTYGSVLVVSGVVADSSSGGEDGRVDDLTCAIRGLVDATPVTPIAADGSFRHVVDCGAISGSIVVEISARDWNSNETVATIALSEGTSDIPSFSVTPGNGQITAEWDVVQEATSYTLYEYISGFEIDLGAEAETYIYTGTEDEPLRNGAEVLLQLRARFDSAYGDSWSDPRSCVPLSQSSLLPETESVDGGVLVRWYDAPAAERYAVLRSTSRDLATFSVERIVTDSQYLDTNVVAGETYYYRVYPDGQPEIVSDAEAGTPQSLLNPTVHLVRSVSTVTRGVQLHRVVGDTLFAADVSGDGQDYLRSYDIYDSSSPTSTGALAVPQLEYDVNFDMEYYNGHVFMVTHDGTDSGIAVIDVSDPVSMSEVNHYQLDADTDGVIREIEIVDGVLYCVIEGHPTDDRFFLVDAASLTVPDAPLSPTYIVDSAMSPSALDWEDPRSIAVHTAGADEYLYMCDQHSDDAAQIQLFAFKLDGTNVPSEAHRVEDGPDATVAEIAGWTDTWTTGEPDFWPRHMVVDSARKILAIVAENSEPFEYAETAHVALFDISTPLAPTFLSTIETGAATGVPAFDGTRMIVPVKDDHLVYVYDLEDTTNPVVVEEIELLTANPMSAVSTSGYYYVAGGWTGTIVLSAGSDVDTEPTLVSPPGLPVVSDLQICGDIVCTIDPNGLVHVLDISAGPSVPTVASVVDSVPPGPYSEPFNSIDVYGSTAIARTSAGLTVIDVSSPTSPAVLATFLEDSGAMYTARHGDVLFVVKQDGVDAVDFSDPADPEVLYSIEIGASPVYASKRGTTIFVPCLSGEVVSIDISDPYDAAISDVVNVINANGIGSPLLSSACVGDFVYGGYSHVGGVDLSIAIVDASDPAAMSDVSLADGRSEFVIEPNGSGVWGGVLELQSLSEDLLIALCGTLDGDGTEITGAKLIGTSLPESPNVLADLGVSCQITYLDWYGNWGYFADQLNGISYLDLRR